MALSQAEIGIGLAALVIGGASVYIFMRASSSNKTEEPKEAPQPDSNIYLRGLDTGKVGTSKAKKHIKNQDVDRARSRIRTLSLQKEINSIVLRRLFEAEDEGEITKDERVKLSKNYEMELSDINDELKQSELIVTLNELELIRDDILQKFEATLNTTQARIDTVLSELKLDRVEPPKPKIEKPRIVTPRIPDTDITQDESETDEEPTEKRTRKPRSDVEEKLEQLRIEVLKELEELEKLELEA